MMNENATVQLQVKPVARGTLTTAEILARLADTRVETKSGARYCAVAYCRGCSVCISNRILVNVA